MLPLSGFPDICGKVSTLLSQIEYTQTGALDSPSSVVVGEGFPGESLYSKCQESKGYLSELSIKGSSEALVTTITGEHLKRLNEDPDLLFTLTSVSVFLAPNINAEDVTSFLLGLEPAVNLESLALTVPLNDTQLLSILNRHTALKYLSLWHTEHLTDASYSALAERGSQFEKLIINGTSRSIESKSVSRLFASLSAVSLLFFKGKAAVESAHLDTLFFPLRKLTTCRLSCLTPEAVEKIKQTISKEEQSSKQWEISRDKLYFKKNKTV